MSGRDIISALANLNAAYAATIDDDRLETWPDFFVAECLYTITSAENVREGNAAGIIYADSRAMLADRVLALRRANIYERQMYRHIIGTPLILQQTDVIHVETPFLVVRTLRDGRMDLFATGRYRDQIVDDGARLQFRERIVICDSSRFDTLLAIPL